MHDKLILDLETKQTFQEVGGHHNSSKLGVSLVGVYSYERGEYRAFREEEIPELKSWLAEATLIIGFNTKHFDCTVLQPYYKDLDLLKLPHLDILEEVVFSLGHRLKLETIAQATLGHGKSGDGLDAIKYYRAGDWASLEKYCLDDVRVTKDVYEYGLSHGHIWYVNNGVKDKIVARWAEGENVEALIKRAHASGLKLAVDYIEDDGATTRHDIDITHLKSTKIQAFSHQLQAVKIFDQSRIKSAQEVGAMSSFQQNLL